MKIGILTYHAPCNFGANLQAYASSRFLESLGHEVKVINYLIEGELFPSYCPKVQAEAHYNFSQSKLHVTRPVHTSYEIFEVVKEEGFDVVAIGADAVWNKKNRDRLSVFYCSWLWGTELENKVKVICLSPAFMGQTYSDLTDSEKNDFKNALQRFTVLNARDEWTKNIINKEILGYEGISVLNPDPVFNVDDFCTEVWMHPAGIEPHKYIIVSLPVCKAGKSFAFNQKWLLTLKKAVNKKGLKLVELPIPDGTSNLQGFDYSVPYPIDPLQWYMWIKNSKGFFGLRFHAIISCLSSGTPFLSLDGYGNMPKWSSLLNMMGFHKFDSKVNISSKIRNLLQGSGLEKYRYNSTRLFLINPIRIVNSLLSEDTMLIKNFRDKNKAIFKNNMEEALSKCKAR